METESELVKKLIQVIIDNDKASILEIISALIEEETKNGNAKIVRELKPLARKIRQLPEEKPVPTAEAFKMATSLAYLIEHPTASHPFITQIRHEHLRHHVITTNELEGKLSRIEQEFINRDKLAHYGLVYRHKILLCGSQGNGKTMSAERIAWNTGLPLIKIQLGAEITDELPDIFRSAAQVGCLLLIEDCELVARLQRVGYDTPETKQLTFNCWNTCWGLIKKYESINGMLVLTTGAPQNLLTEDVWRHFHDVIELKKPNSVQMRAIIEQTLCGMKLEVSRWKEITDNLVDFSAAQIVSVAREAAKDVILDGEETVTQFHLQGAIKDLLHRRKTETE